jgi:hypothetical protein
MTRRIAGYGIPLVDGRSEITPGPRILRNIEFKETPGDSTHNGLQVAEFRA